MLNTIHSALMNLQYKFANWWNFILKNPLEMTEGAKYKNNSFVEEFHLEILILLGAVQLILNTGTMDGLLQ